MHSAVERHAARPAGVGRDVVDLTDWSGRRTGGEIERLSVREREVLGLMADGLSNAAISDRLFISPKTLERHISTIFVKLELAPGWSSHRRVAAVLRYLGQTRGAVPA